MIRTNVKVSDPEFVGFGELFHVDLDRGRDMTMYGQDRYIDDISTLKGGIVPLGPDS